MSSPLFHSSLELILSGANSAVYKAHHNVFGSVAVKVTPLTNQDAALKEIELLRACQGSPYVVGLIDWARHADFIGFSQEICEQGDLLDFVKEFSFPERSIVTCMTQLGAALHYIHRVAGIIHQDVKPENIGVTRKGEIRLLDFSCSTKMNTSCHAGTVEYASPEKLQRKPVCFGVDWWAYGVVLFELVFGHLPFDQNTPEETSRAICEQSISTLAPNTSNTFEENAWSLVQKLLHKDIKARACVNAGFENILNEPFFESIDFNNVLFSKAA